MKNHALLSGAALSGDQRWVTWVRMDPIEKWGAGVADWGSTGGLDVDHFYDFGGLLKSSSTVHAFLGADGRKEF